MIHSYVIGRGNTATAYLQAGMIRPVPGATADAVVDVQGLRQAASPARGRTTGFLFPEKMRAQKMSASVPDGKKENHSELDGETSSA